MMTTFSMKRVNAIFVKDWKDLQRNSYVLFTLALPLFFAAWLGRIGADSAEMIAFPIVFALVIAGAFVQAAMVAEEKEKNTLRGLLLSPASVTEVFVGKSLLSAVSTLVVVVGCIWLAEFNVPSLPLFALSILLGLIFFLAIGTLLGLLSRTVMETSIIGMPVMVIFGMSSMFKSMITNETILTVLDYLPNELLTKIWVGLESGTAVGESFLFLVLWAVGAIAATVIVYRKRRMD
ncbi:ABC-type transport system involved in multi-copper enzyme maturation, permease component [Bhargavaea cecembensis DSE10]|uniref:ABC-type transport system involved in multi-copper enzyme maturation, permease component n=2 Tax=Bhargavaea cecembensis TaxID=394098 RepID=M7P7H8_9BACL|nr:ABC-type transport system involved in multi-copper enzyme maturation, permease component [Bhargavaea cecembensis DSE10]